MLNQISIFFLFLLHNTHSICTNINCTFCISMKKKITLFTLICTETHSIAHNIWAQNAHPNGKSENQKMKWKFL